MQKRDNEKKKYFPYKVPDTWHCPLYVENMNEIVNCPHCAKELPYWMTYTSRTIHNHMWLWYGVCEECYKEELKLWVID